MNENNNLNLNNEMQSDNEQVNKKNNNKILYIIIGILVVAIIGCITIVMNKPKEEKENKPEEEIVEKEEINNENESSDNNLTTDENDDITIKDETEDEEEIEENEDVIEGIHAGDKYEKYYYLIDRLISPSNTTIFNSNFDIKNIDNDFMLFTAISSLLDENETDKMDVMNHECYAQIKDEEYRYVEGYKSSRVIEKAKDIFGKNIKISITKDKVVGTYTYVKDTDGYVNINDAGCGMGYYGSMLNFVIESVEDTKTQLVITGNAYSYNYMSGELSNINSKEVIKKYEDGMTSELEAQQYVKQNKDKFNQYKFTFTLEDGNYIFTGFEKLK